MVLRPLHLEGQSQRARKGFVIETDNIKEYGRNRTRTAAWGRSGKERLITNGAARRSRGRGRHVTDICPWSIRRSAGRATRDIVAVAPVAFHRFKKRSHCLAVGFRTLVSHPSAPAHDVPLCKTNEAELISLGLVEQLGVH